MEVFCVPVITLALFTHFRTACGGKHFPTIVLLLYAVNILSSNLYRQERNGQIRGSECPDDACGSRTV